MPHRSSQKGFFTLLVVLVIGVALAAVGWYFYHQYTTERKETKVQTSGKVMRVARYYWPGQFWVEIADKKKWFSEAGLPIELVDTNSDFYASQKDVIDGRLDTQDFYLFDLMVANTKGADLVMVINNDLSSGAEGAIVGKTIANANDLKGKKIALTKGSNFEFIFDIYLDKNNINKEDVILVDTLSEKASESFQKGEVDGFVAYEPYLSEAVEKFGGRKLFDTSEIPGVSIAGYTFRREFIDERPNDVQAFVNVWHKTTQFMKENPEEAFAIIATNNGKTPGEVQAFTQQAKIQDLRDNTTAFSYSAGFESLHGTARKVNDFLIEQGITDKQLDSTTFLDAQFIRTLSRSSE